MHTRGRERGWKDTLKVVRFFMDHAEEDELEEADDSSENNFRGTSSLQGSDLIRTLQLLELSVRGAIQ